MGVSPTEGKIFTGRIGGGVKRASNKGSVTRLPRGPRSEVSVKRVRTLPLQGLDPGGTVLRHFTFCLWNTWNGALNSERMGRSTSSPVGGKIRNASLCRTVLFS